MTASKINLANIDLTIKVHRHEELERRMTEIERRLKANNAEETDPQVTRAGQARGRRLPVSASGAVSEPTRRAVWRLASKS
jgi:hypothetical protein